MSLIEALTKLAEDLERAKPKPFDPRPRFENGRYRDCKWCQGRGCVSCKIEADKEYARQFPSGPQPIATFDMTNEADIERAKKVIGRDAIEKAFGPNGGGVQEIIDNAKANPPLND